MKKLIMLVIGILFLLPNVVIAKNDTDKLSPLEKRLRLERESLSNRFAIIPHKPNYILPATYNSEPNNEPFEFFEDKIDQFEIKFQLSIKTVLWPNIFGENGHISFAYTQQSFWQAYSTERSSPFRETNYEPELMLSFFNDYNILGLKNRIITLGFAHQSNGQSGTLSRSWNRVYTSFIFEKGNFYLSFKPWYRLHEAKENDDNPDIDKFLGHGEIQVFYCMEDHMLGLMLRNNLRSDNRGAIQLDWSFPLTDKLKCYIQYFKGYGESLIDYNHSNNRLGIGIMLTDWL
jgi:phospholipase A1